MRDPVEPPEYRVGDRVVVHSRLGHEPPYETTVRALSVSISTPARWVYELDDNHCAGGRRERFAEALTPLPVVVQLAALVTDAEAAPAP